MSIYILSNIPTESEESYQDFVEKPYKIIGIIMQIWSNHYFDLYLQKTSRQWSLDL